VQTFLPVANLCSSRLEEMKAVVNSVSAAVPAPQQLEAGKVELKFFGLQRLLPKTFVTY